MSSIFSSPSPHSRSNPGPVKPHTTNTTPRSQVPKKASPERKKVFAQTVRQVGATASSRLSRTTGIQRLVLLGSLLILAGIIFLRPGAPHTTTKSPTTNSNLSSSRAKLPKETPDFATLLPTGKSAESLGGWTRISPADRNPVYAYPDKLAGIIITVSEQPLPEEFVDDVSGSIQKLAEGYSADRTLDIKGTTVYIGQSVKGPQSVIFAAKGLLILIKSAATIPDEQWINYISSLQ